jgi:predicted GTPase
MKLGRFVSLYWRELLLAVLVTAPIAVLPALGFLWLWAEGWHLHWLGASALATVFLVLAPRYLKRRAHGLAAPERPGASEIESRALSVLDERLRRIDDLKAIDPKSVVDEAEATVRAIAAVHYPNDPHAHLRSTLPEVLLMAETIARDLRDGIQREFPLLRHASFAWYPQGTHLYDSGRRLWTVARLLRLANPLAAALSEVRGVVLSLAIDRLGDHAKRRLAAYLVREVGLVSIQLYSGGFRRRAEELADAAPGAPGAAEAGPVTVLFAGQPGAGKSALLNALAGRVAAASGPQAGAGAFLAHDLTKEGLIVLDGPGLSGTPDRKWLRHAASADIVVWVAKANETARNADMQALAALRAAAAAEPFRRRAPILLVLTHADKLAPSGEWAPPYDPVNGEGRKEQSMRMACAAWETALGLTGAIPVRCDAPRRAWNIDALRARLADIEPQARARQLERASTPFSVVESAFDVVTATPSLLRRLRAAMRRPGRAVDGANGQSEQDTR